VERRLLREETIATHVKVFSRFEPHTGWIQKGKQPPNVELGHRLLVALDEQQLIQGCAVLRREAEADQSTDVDYFNYTVSSTVVGPEKLEF
jgi:transposase, IS5 family